MRYGNRQTTTSGPHRKVIARHSWVAGASITETVDNQGRRHFTATIRGWRMFPIWSGPAEESDPILVARRVQEIRDRIDQGDQSVFELLPAEGKRKSKKQQHGK